MTLELVDLDALKDAAIKKFDDHLSRTPRDAPMDREVAQLQAELEQIYRVVVLLQKNETDMECIAELWGKMVSICDECVHRLSSLVASRPTYRAWHDRILALRNAAENRRQVHCRA